MLWKYGEERMSRRIAKAIVARRAENPVARTSELAELVARVVGGQKSGKHPATRTFQAIAHRSQSANSTRSIADSRARLPGFGRAGV